MRPVQLIEKPQMNPHSCIKCGSGPNNREFFVDLGIESVMHHNDHTGQKHLTDGVIYICNECMQSIINDYYRHVFRIINNRIDQNKALEVSNDSTVQILQKEVAHLQGVNNDLRKENDTIRAEYTQKRIEAEQELETTAAELLSNLIGEEENNDTGTDDSNVDGSNSSAEGTDSSASSTDESDAELNSDSLFDLQQGFLVKRD